LTLSKQSEGQELILMWTTALQYTPGLGAPNDVLYSCLGFYYHATADP